MPTMQALPRSKRAAKLPKLEKGKPSLKPVELTLYGLEDLDEETLRSLSVDTPARLTPPPGSDSTSQPSPDSLSKMQDKVMEATLERLGFGPPDDLSHISVSPTLTRADSEVSAAQTSAHGEKVPNAEEPTAEADEYCQIIGLFQRVAQRTGHSVTSLILEWALLHARTNMVERQAAHGHVSDAMSTHQHAFEEGVNNAVELGNGLADRGFDFMFIMVGGAGKSMSEDVSCKIWSTSGLQGMFKDLSLSDDEILAAARMHSYSSMWSQFCNKRKRRQMEPPVDHNDKIATGVVSADASSFISKQSAAAASAFLSASHKNREFGVKKGRLPPASGKGIPSSLTPCDSSLLDNDTPRTVKSERSALSMLQDVLLGRD